MLGSGAIPAIRIGSQPYGILPATKLSRMDWLTRPLNHDPVMRGADAFAVYLRRLYRILRAIETDWHNRFSSNSLSFVGKTDGDPHRILLDILGLHPGSVEWSQRYAESLQIAFNRLQLQGWGGLFEAFGTALQFQNARVLLNSLGYTGDKQPPILELIFNGKHNLLKGGVVDDQPLSEGEPIRAYTPGGQNYIQWLIDAANDSLDALYAQNGFTDDKPPTALLYLMLRHALQLGYHDVSIRLHEGAGLYTPQAAALARTDDPFLHIRDNQLVSESRYQPLYAIAQPITGSATQPVHKFIAAQLTTLAVALGLRDQVKALEYLKSQPTAALERAFGDHMDCCAYRLDAWLQGLLNYQLAAMRNLRDRQDIPARQGVYLGAFGWVEELRPENKVLTEVELTDKDLIDQFGNPKEPPLMRDSTNQGYVHAPSLNHAVAAAVLRNGFISNASPENRQTMAVNLTSERVRVALAILEGIRAGQSLADLLGYQFERGLHDAHGLAEVDKFIYDLRLAFPLRANRIRSTQTTEAKSISEIEARNVINGLALVEHIKSTGNRSYRFGKTGLEDANDDQRKAIDAEAERLLDAHDAVADLALAEGVYQAVLGNYDRVASTYDAYARATFPPEPDVIRTPLNGKGLTHRVALHLEAGVSHINSPTPGISMSPRARGEPALNRWLAGVLPPPDQVGCVVAFREAATGNDVTQEVTLENLDLQAADLVALIRDDDRQTMGELDDRIVRFAVDHFGPRPDVPISIRYLEKVAAPYSVFELMPLVRNLRRLTTRSRPLRETDLTLMNEAESKQDEEPSAHIARLQTVANEMQTLRNDLATFQARLEGPLGDLENRRDEILADVDDYVDDLVALLARAAQFVIVQAGWGFAYDFRQRTFAAVLRQFEDRVAEWDARLVEFDALLAEEAALPLTATDEKRFALLTKAEQAVAAATAAALPATPAAYRADLVNVKRVDFDNKRGDLADVANTTQTAVSALLTDVSALLPLTQFDSKEFTLTAREDEMVRFAEDAVAVVKVIIAECDRRLTAAQDLFQEHADAATATERVRALEGVAKALLGEDFRIIPEFQLSATRGAELANALAASRSGELFEFLTTPPDPAETPLDFPIDTWLYGVARVREKLHCAEKSVVLAGALGRPEPELDALQLPFAPGDRWRALQFPADQPLERDELLYTAHFSSAFDPTLPQCGLLLDEWTETIPGDSADTGIAFHHDRPNCEAPQTMLLVTPSDFRGEWRWDGLVDALNETLDFAKRRAVEPKHIDATPYAPFLPATVMATQVWQLTIAADLALNNKIAVRQD